MKKVTKAVILAAGLGTRMLPATKSVPKELFPIVDKPALQYIVEELAASGIKDIMIIISRGKTLIEDHFDKSPELEERLEAGGEKKKKLLDLVKDIASDVKIVYTRQKEMLGTGHALQQAASFTGDDPFVVCYGDDVIINDEYPVAKQSENEYNIGERSGTHEARRYSLWTVRLLCRDRRRSAGERNKDNKTRGGDS